MNKYNQLDAAILSQIAEGGKGFNVILARNNAMARPFCNEGMEMEPWRVIDRRLQALRKAKKIVYRGRFWHMVTP